MAGTKPVSWNSTALDDPPLRRKNEAINKQRRRARMLCRTWDLHTIYVRSCTYTKVVDDSFRGKEEKSKRAKEQKSKKQRKVRSNAMLNTTKKKEEGEKGEDLQLVWVWGKYSSLVQ